MYLAKGRNGQIGRQVPGVSVEARVNNSPMGDRRGNLYVSHGSIEDDSSYYANLDAQQKAMDSSRYYQRLAMGRAEEASKAVWGMAAMQSQRSAQFDPVNEQLKRHFARKAAMGEDQATAESLSSNGTVAPTDVPSMNEPQIQNPVPSIAQASGRYNHHAPPDFSQEGGNVQLIPSQTGRRPIMWSADFRQHLIMGNPLTRDGRFGPRVTDYDRYVHGLDVNQTDVVDLSDGAQMAGGTMLGRYDGRVMRAGLSGMGDDSGDGSADTSDLESEVDSVEASSDPNVALESQDPFLPPTYTDSGDTLPTDSAGNITVPADVTTTTTPSPTFWDKLSTNAQSDLAKALPASLASQVKSGALKITGVSPTGVVTVATPAQIAAMTGGTIMGMPSWAVYAAGGVFALGFLFMIIRSRSE